MIKRFPNLIVGAFSFGISQVAVSAEPYSLEVAADIGRQYGLSAESVYLCHTAGVSSGAAWAKVVKGMQPPQAPVMPLEIRESNMSRYCESTAKKSYPEKPAASEIFKRACVAGGLAKFELFYGN